jgi:hypothetical protein
VAVDGLQEPGTASRALHQAPELRRLAQVSRRQFGAFTYEQILAAGLSKAWLRQRLDRGDFVRLHRSVFALEMAPPLWERNAIAACLAGPPPTVLSHGSAARAFRMSLARDEALLEVTTPHESRWKPGGVRVHRTRFLHPADKAKVNRLPVTSVARTLIDLAATESGSVLRNVLDDALTRRLTKPNLVLAAIERNRCRRRPGSDVLERALIPWLANPLESPAEAEVLRMLSAAGLPAPLAQVTEVAGDRVLRLDFAWIGPRVALEVDGFRYHDGPDRFVSDRQRANLLTDAGWHVLRTTLSEMQRDPTPLCRALRRLLDVESA